MILRVRCSHCGRPHNRRVCPWLDLAPDDARAQPDAETFHRVARHRFEKQTARANCSSEYRERTHRETIAAAEEEIRQWREMQASPPAPVKRAPPWCSHCLLSNGHNRRSCPRKDEPKEVLELEAKARWAAQAQRLAGHETDRHPAPVTSRADALSPETRQLLDQIRDVLAEVEAEAMRGRVAYTTQLAPRVQA